MARNTHLSKSEGKNSSEENIQHSRAPNEVNNRKRNMTLDLNSARNFNCKKSKFDITKSGAPVLSSPDLNMLKLGSPELEKLIIQQSNLNNATPTPTSTALEKLIQQNNMNSGTPTSQILFPKTVTEEQEKYAKGFVDALKELQGSDSSQGGSQAIDISSNSSSNNSMTYTDLEPQTMSSRQVSSGFGPFSLNYNSVSPLDVVIKDEPQTVPSICSSPPLSPINMECQEIIKLERKRQRNRLAASKCRKRKLERIAKLEDKVKNLKAENTDLATVVLKLKNQVCLLKEKVLEHVHSGCQIMSTNQYC